MIGARSDVVVSSSVLARATPGILTAVAAVWFVLLQLSAELAGLAYLNWAIIAVAWIGLGSRNTDVSLSEDVFVWSSGYPPFRRSETFSYSEIEGADVPGMTVSPKLNIVLRSGRQLRLHGSGIRISGRLPDMQFDSGVPHGPVRELRRLAAEFEARKGAGERKSDPR